MLSCNIASYYSMAIAVEPLNVDTLKSGHLFYTGHFVWSQHSINFTPEIRTPL